MMKPTPKPTPKPTLSRRMFLRGAAGAPFALPLLNDVLDPRSAYGATFPKRLFVYFTPNGTVPAAFFGAGDTTNLTLGDITAPLAPYKNDLLILDNLDNKVSMMANGDPHGVGVGCMLSGTKLLTGAAAVGMSSGGWSAGISVDQYVANTVGKATRRLSLDLAGKNLGGSIFSRMSYGGPAQPVSPESNPQAAFDLIFNGVSGNDPASIRRRTLKKSVLDEVSGQLDAVAARLSGPDSQKVQAHAAYVRDIETRLLMNVGNGSCKPPVRPDVGAGPRVSDHPFDPQNAGHEDINAADDVIFPKVIKAHLDLIVGAFACDVTRVATLMAAPSRSDVVMQWLGLSSAHHEMSHQSDTEGAPGLIKVNAWYAQQLAAFIAALKAVPEGNGTLFDNTLILWCNELGVGNVHSHTRVPFLLAGSCGGYFKTGRYISFPTGTPHNNLLASISLAMGVPLTNNTFGDPMFCTGPLPGLTA